MELQLIEHLTNSEVVIKTRILKKLNKLYNGKILQKSESGAFINLSDHNLIKDQEKYLNLGVYCHLLKKYSKLCAESTKQRFKYNKNILTQELKQATIELGENENITIERTEISSIYVKMNTSEYQAKLNNIRNDEKKVKQIFKDTTEQLKKKANSLIKTL